MHSQNPHALGVSRAGGSVQSNGLGVVDQTVLSEDIRGAEPRDDDLQRPEIGLLDTPDGCNTRSYVQRLPETIASISEHAPSTCHRVEVGSSTLLRGRAEDNRRSDDNTSKCERGKLGSEHRCWGVVLEREGMPEEQTAGEA